MTTIHAASSAVHTTRALGQQLKQASHRHEFLHPLSPPAERLERLDDDDDDEARGRQA
jgi:hypothetical protein